VRASTGESTFSSNDNHLFTHVAWMQNPCSVDAKPM
jgi:hypothetical protein